MLVCLLAAGCALGLVTADAARASHEGSPRGGPDLEAEAWQLIDASSGESLASHDPGRPRPVASATKLMTAWVALRRLEFRDVVRAAPYAASPAESLLGLEPGEFASVKDLMYGLILPSGNDAAVTLAHAAAGSVPSFVGLMNREARRLGLEQSRFANPIGLDQAGNHSSAGDLAALSARLLAIPRFARIAAARQAVLRSFSPRREVETRNTLLHELPWADGVKTGHTQGAGYVLVGSGTRGSTQLIAAVLGTDSMAARDRETEELLRYGMSMYRERAPLRRGGVAGRVDLRYGGEPLPARAARTISAGVRPGQELEVRLHLPESAEGPLEVGSSLGTAVLLVDGRPVDRTALVAGRNVPEATILMKILHTPWALLALIAAGLFLTAAAVALRRRRRDQTEDWMPAAMSSDPLPKDRRQEGSR